VNFTWFDDLSFPEMLERSAKLPPNSFVLFVLLMRDASGVTHNGDAALRRLHEVANAPVNGLFENQLGLGILGGRLYPDEDQGIESARIAVRILRGEPASSFPPRLLRPTAPQYDWRELQRWNIPESRLPAGSTIRFRQPTLWESYKWYILGALAVLTLETLLIFFLVANSLRRRRAEGALRESEQRLNLAAAAAEIGMWMWDIAPNEVWATENCRRMFEFPARAVIRYETFLQRVHPDDRAAVEFAVRHALEDGNDYVCEYRVILPDGVERWVAARGRPEVTGNGETKRLLGACVDVTTRKRAEETAQQLSGRLLHAHEEERARLARALHDGLSQNLALLSIEMEMFGQRLPETARQINERLEGFSKEAKRLSAEVHGISHGLHPAKLTQLGLTVALRSFCREVERAHDIEVRFEARDVPRELPPEAALCLYRVAQEAIQNVVKHSGSKRATVELETTGNRICLLVTDDGKGFETGAERGSGSLGLVSMQERVRLVKGEVSVKSELGEGTRVEARVPLPTEYHI
jgi:PAS domain S-box-containing protein